METKIAITGGIGSGKSTVLGYIRRAGYPVFSCDEIYKEVLRSHSYVQKISEEFPSCVENGEIDKDKLAAIIFQDESKRKSLNEIAHPLIMKSLFEKMENCTERFVFAEVPLLFEGNYQKQFDKVIVLLRENKMRVSSVMSRDGLLEREVLDRMASQFDYSSDKAEKIFKECNAILIDNDKSEEELQGKIKELLSEWA